ncbi:SH3 domain-containing protein [Streptomyces sp. SID11385]|uniref:SH3 domain-containing protein n=1 Tax=Streptomyces sp. SID11385 TaxID=2706031 RepID=UPI0013CB75B8|nr:SH3 domain-containing protein [Streptomyces sp. SID11385]NEA38353.1 SH3 domain-containing protein [Streptomyces sp. SID11385]
MRATRTAAALVGVLLTGTVLATPALANDQTGTQTITSPAAAKYAKGKVVSRIELNVREKPTTNHSRVLRTVKPGQIIELRCKIIDGQSIDGNSVWYRTGHKGWVSARYVKNLSYVKRCDA